MAEVSVVHVVTAVGIVRMIVSSVVVVFVIALAASRVVVAIAKLLYSLM